MYIYPYKSGSQSAKILKEGLDAKLIKLQDSKFKGSDKKFVINWGNSTMNEELLKSKVLNNPEAVALASNKLKFFSQVKDVVSIPPYTTDKSVAETWLREGKQVLLRTSLQGSGGNDITILEDMTDFEQTDHSLAKVYTQYVKKKDEYRVHVMGGKVVDVQRKSIKKDLEGRSNLDFRIRNHAKGFVFVREGVEPPQELLDEAVSAVGACGLDFGAVDVIWNNYYKQAYVLEVNTAPGLEGSTVETYIKGLTDLYNQVLKKKKSYGGSKPSFSDWVNEVYPTTINIPTGDINITNAS